METLSAPTRPIDVTDATFGPTLRAHRLVLVDNWAEWCAPCHVIAPSLDRLASELAGKLVVAKLDVDANPAVPAAYGVMGLPTLLLFRDGALVERLVGAMPYEAIRARLAPHLA